MQRTSFVVGLFRDRDRARDAIEELRRLGFAGGDVGAVMPAGADRPERWEEVAPRYRARWAQLTRGADARWEDHERPYRYGWEQGQHPAFRGRSWAEVEPDLRRDWETRHRDTAAWDEVAEPIRRVWGERVGSAGHPVRPRTTEAHLAALAAADSRASPARRRSPAPPGRLDVGAEAEGA